MVLGHLDLEDRYGTPNIWEVLVLDHAVGHVDTEAVDSTVEPEAEHTVELGANLFVLPVEIRLRDIEEVQVPRAVANRLPRRTAKHRGPVRWWHLSVIPLALFEDVAISRSAPWLGSECLLEPHMIG